MKLRVLISILFIIATTFTALHEIEHITGEHDSASCQICIVDDHSVSCDIIDEYVNITLFSFDDISSQKLYSKTHTKKTANHSNAPPKIS